MVTGVAQPVLLEDADRAVNVLDARESPELFHTWTDYLELEGLVDLQQRGPRGVQSDVSIRGSQFGQTLVLVNGLRVNDAQSGHHNLDVPLPPASLERIEVLRGSGSTFYGSDAMGGAVNFIVSPPEHSEFRLGFGAGNFGINEQDASATYVTRRYGEQVSFIRDFSSGFMPDRDYRTLAFASDSHLKSKPGNSSLLLAHGDRPFGADQFYGNFDSWERTKSWLALFTQEIGERTQVAFGFRRHTDNFVLLRDHPAVYANEHQTVSWQLAIRRRQPLARNTTFSYGAEGYRDSIDSNNLGRHARNSAAGYMNLDVRALRRFSFSAGVRDDLYGNWRHEISPNISGGVWLSAALKLRAAVTQAFRRPSYTDLYYHDPATIGNPGLKPEHAWNYEAGLDVFPADKLGGAVTLFHRRERDGIDYVRRFAGDLWHAVNFEALHYTGVESALRVRLAQSRVGISYTWLEVSQGPLAGLISRYVGNVAVHNGAVTWQGGLPGKFIGRTAVGVTQRQGRDPYALWDLSLSRRMGHFAPYVQLSNLTNTAYDPIPGVRMPGRSVVAGCELIFVSGAAGKK